MLKRHLNKSVWGLLVLFCWSKNPSVLTADPVAVRVKEGLVHGFLVLRNQDGTTIADGELTQVTHGDRVTAHLLFRFKDGSRYDDTTVFSQRGTFRLVRDRLIQTGPAFKHPMDTTVDVMTGTVTVRYKDNGKDKILTEQMVLPPDVSNGLLLTLLKDIHPNQPRTTVSMVATSPKPRLIKLVIVPQEEVAFAVGSLKQKATHYVVKVDLGGVTGVVAPLIGKQPPDTHVWVLGGAAPAFVRSEGPLAEDGPIWRIDLVSPAIRSDGRQ